MSVETTQNLLAENRRLKRECDAALAKLEQAREELDKVASPTTDAEALQLDLTVTRLALEKSGEYGRWAEKELEKLRAQLADANESLAATIESEAQLAEDLDAERELIAKLDQDNAQLSGQLQDARERLASFETAEAIADETRAKRYHDGLGDD